MAPGLLMHHLLVGHHLANFLAVHPFDFVLHRFSATFFEMRSHKTGGFADFLHHRGRDVWIGAGCYPELKTYFGYEGVLDGETVPCN